MDATIRRKRLAISMHATTDQVERLDRVDQAEEALLEIDRALVEMVDRAFTIGEISAFSLATFNRETSCWQQEGRRILQQLRATSHPY